MVGCRAGAWPDPPATTVHERELASTADAPPHSHVLHATGAPQPWPGRSAGYRLRLCFQLGATAQGASKEEGLSLIHI
eukprot:13384751-Alexandrium_andersonii.AAC.1